ncbi:MAG: protein kinase [Rhodospirillales bacterium]|nr:protein kinase [Rhodospirillales bacterium]
MSSTISRIGKYELRRVVFPRIPTNNLFASTVYDAWDTDLERRVAVKTINIAGAVGTNPNANLVRARGDVGDNDFADGLRPQAGAEDSLSDFSSPDLHEGSDALDRFRRSARGAAKLVHPHIASVYDYGETNDVAYIVMEFLDGPTLKELFERKQRFDLNDTIDIVCSILDALEYSHQNRVVHRDIKPANVMFTSGMRLKLTDFGIARIEDSSVTQTGTIMGTPAYMSPEQFLGEKVDLRADIYSTGVILYEMLTGERPYEGTVATIMHKVLYTSPPPPSRISSIANPALDAIVARAMAKKRDQRFESASAFLSALRAAADANSAPSGPDHPNTDFFVGSDRSPGLPGDDRPWERDHDTELRAANRDDRQGATARGRTGKDGPTFSASARDDFSRSRLRSSGPRLSGSRTSRARSTGAATGPGRSPRRTTATIVAALIILALAGGTALWLSRSGTHSGRLEIADGAAKQSVTSEAGSVPASATTSSQAAPSMPALNSPAQPPTFPPQPAASVASHPSTAMRAADTAQAGSEPTASVVPALPSPETSSPPALPASTEPDRSKTLGDAGGVVNRADASSPPLPDPLPLPIPPPQAPPPQAAQLPPTPLPSFTQETRPPRKPTSSAPKPSDVSSLPNREPRVPAGSGPQGGAAMTQRSQAAQLSAQDTGPDHDNSTLPDWLRSARKKLADASPPPVAAATQSESPVSDVPVTSVSGLVGLTCQSVTTETARSLGLESPQGMIVQGVTSGSPASKAGISRNDVILSINGERMRELSGLRRFAGQKIPVELLRQGRHLTVQLQIADS